MQIIERQCHSAFIGYFDASCVKNKSKNTTFILFFSDFGTLFALDKNEKYYGL